MEHKKRMRQPRGGRGISRRKFLGVTAGATAALSFGTFIRSGLGAAKVNILTWSNTLRAMDDVLREQAREYTKAKGVEVSFEFINQTDLPAKTAAAVESGAGPDIITLWSDGPHLHAKALIDVNDVTESLGKELKGWTNIGKDIATVGKSWKAVPWGIIPIALTYREDWLKEVGYTTFPDTWDELLVASKKLKDKGHPVGFSLGRAIGDGNQFHYPLLWAFGGAECKQDGKTVAINSPETVKAVDYLTLNIDSGDFAALSGPSGSGKTTILNLIGALDSPTSGRVFLEDRDLGGLSRTELSVLRRDRIGFVFQTFNLIPVFTAYENAEFVLSLQGVPEKEKKERVLAIFEEVGLNGLEGRRPDELSGGQQQRVAIARAIATEPAIVLADEPTANVDSVTADSLLDLMEELNRAKGTTFLFSTHDPRVIERARRVVRLRDGKVASDEVRS